MFLLVFKYTYTIKYEFILLGVRLDSFGFAVHLPLTDPALTCVWALGLLAATVWASVHFACVHTCVCVHVHARM